MSETSIKQLAELIGAPVDTLLQQLQDADIEVSGADDSISDAQKLKLLEHIRLGQSAPAKEGTTKKAGGKISLKRRSTSELNVGGAKSSVSVEVRRKKSFTRPAQKAAAPDINTDDLAASSNRTDELSEQLSKERKAREDAVDANKQAKQDRKLAGEERKAQKEAENADKKAEYEKTKQTNDDSSENEKVESTTETVAEIPEEPAKPVVPLTPKEQREALAAAARA